MIEYIEHIGNIGEARTAEHLVSFLVVNAPGIRKRYASAARDAIEKLGVATVPYLIPNLDDPKVQVWTAEMLRRLTGAKPRDDKRRTWEKWYRQNRRKLEAADR
jgi:hypothetical protein